MIGKDWAYKGLDMSISNINTSKINITNVEHDTNESDEIIQNANDHGSSASNTRESGRLFTFEGYVFGLTKEDRGAAWEALNEAINIEPFLTTNPFYLLTFKTDSDEERQVYVKVRSKPKPVNGVNDSRIKFTFELYADTNAVISPTEESANGSSGFIGGVNFPMNFPDAWGNQYGGTSCTNDGNYKAGCLITVTGTLVNPRVINITNGLSYKISGTTTSLTLDSRDGGWVVLDNGVNARNRRISGLPILLTPGANVIMVTDDTGADADVNVKWHDTWNTI